MATDEALCALAQQGDTSAFDRLYARYEHRLFGFTLRLLGDTAEAEEVFHDTFLKVLEAPPARFDGAPRFSAWLFHIARNLCANKHRGRARGDGALLRLRATDEQVPTPEDRAQEHERATALSRAVRTLPQTLSEVFHLQTSGLSYEEIASVLEVPVGTVKSRMNLRDDIDLHLLGCSACLRDFLAHKRICEDGSAFDERPSPVLQHRLRSVVAAKRRVPHRAAAVWVMAVAALTHPPL